jgi:hypothetical protein
MSGGMAVLMVVVVWVINFVISWFNAKTVGLMWSETKQIGGWQRFMAWMGAIMSASGFTWCYLVVALCGVYYGQPMFLKEGQDPVMTIDGLKAGFALGYLIIIPGILFSGFMIWIDSLVQAWRRRDLPSIGTAAWNTFAQVHNSYRAMRGVPEAIGTVFDFFGGGGKSKSSKNAGGLIIIAIVVLVCISGILTTWGIINKYAGSRALPLRDNQSWKWGS